jgi:hemoglobin-like flavoprotein
MTPEERRLVQESFAKVAPIAEQAAALFYQNLFVADPSLRMLFHGDMGQQGHKLMAMIATAVHGLERFEALVPVIQELARRHAGYGVRAGHYDTVGAVLLQTLEQGLGAVFTSPVRRAWASLYAELAGTMKDAAYGGERAALPVG